MKISLHNTLLRRKQEFTPIDENNVRMYVCGPTVYDRAHLGNAKTSVVFDVLYRFLCQVYGKDHVTYVSNITDVDDKILNKHKETGKSIREITEQTFQWYLDDMKKLNVLNPNHRPRATEYIQEMIELVKLLLQNGHAYEAEGHVLFSVDSMPNYGFLSGRSMKEMLAGARIEVADYKKNPADFILWKPSEADQPGWDSPWGYGRPGWHLECSAMSSKLLGDSFDIHGGMGYNVAKAATLGTGKMAWQGTKLVGNATGVTPKLRQARDKVVSGVSSGLKSLFTFGRATSKSRAPVSRLRGSDAPAPTPSSSSSGGASPVTAEQARQAERVENAAPRPTTPAKPVTAANTAKPNQAGAEGTAPTSPEAARERQIDQFNRKKAAGLDLANNSEIYKQVSERCGQATANRDAAAQRARNFEAQAKEEKDKATALRQKAQSMADGAEKDAVMRQAGSSDQKADEFTAQAAEERKNEKENDAIVQENLKKMDEMQKEREQSISDKEIDSIMKQRYGNNYRTEQSANINGWNFK